MVSRNNMHQGVAYSSAFSEFPHETGVLETTSASTSSASNPPFMSNPGNFSNLGSAPQMVLDSDPYKSSLHGRQNFGNKDRMGGYVKPEARFAPVHSSAPLASKPHVVPPVQYAAEHDTLSDNEMPFDMLNDIKRKQMTPSGYVTPPEAQPTEANRIEGYAPGNFESVWASSPQQKIQDQSSELHENRGKFSFHPPRYSEPSMVQDIGTSQIDGGSKSGFSHSLIDSTHQVDRVQPPGAATNFVVMQSPENLEGADQMSDGDDSLFDFEEEVREVEPQYLDGNSRPVKVTHKIRRRIRQTRDAGAEADDNSMERNRPKGSPTNLQERAQQAWKSRQKKNSSLKNKNAPKKAKGATVSFGVTDTVHHFQPDEETDDTCTYPSGDDRSLNSEYTKTLESEVEDMIKDILFIGNGTTSRPGRRKYKYKHEVKKKFRKRPDGLSDSQEGGSLDEIDEDMAAVSRFRVNVKSKSEPIAESNTVDIGQVETTSMESETEKELVMIGEVIRNASSGMEPGAESHEQSNQEGIDDTQPSMVDEGGEEFPDVVGEDEKEEEENKDSNSLWGMVEGGMTAMTAALGMGVDDSAKKEESVSDADAKDVSTCNDQPLLPFETCTGGVAPEPEDTPKPRLTHIFDYAQDFMYGNVGESLETYDNTASQSKESAEEVEEAEGATPPLPFSSSDMGADPSLKQLALHAAKSVHQLQGVQFDVSSEIDMYTDVKISVVELKLPLGLIFLENNGGCFVTKVSPDGSAARSGGVEVGDQLASIDGNSSAKMKVDDICKMITHSANPKCVELVFVRYTGPFRPSRNLGRDVGSFDLEAAGSPHGSFESFPSTTPTTGPTPQQERMKKDTQGKRDTQGKKRGFRLFGRNKKKK